MTAEESEPAESSEQADNPDPTNNPEPSGPLWDDLLADARTIAEEYREDGWDAVVLEPTAVSPVDTEERIGLDVTVSSEAYGVVEDLIEEGNVTITAADVYYRPLGDEGSDRRVALTVERDEASETAIFVPLAYDLTDCRAVFERALVEEELLTHVTAAETERWVSFSHDDPSLFLEAEDVRAWNAD
ncbi:DUF7529 family protein [Natrinema sp. LN54]|uniref:DUF7529 family protein n=1 Tax=Natrinema sp. LN54 TaxID=3458705 RepID=UPI004035D285